jgi:hypothetical protein
MILPPSVHVKCFFKADRGHPHVLFFSKPFLDLPDNKYCISISPPGLKSNCISLIDTLLLTLFSITHSKTFITWSSYLILSRTRTPGIHFPFIHLCLLLTANVWSSSCCHLCHISTPPPHGAYIYQPSPHVHTLLSVTYLTSFITGWLTDGRANLVAVAHSSLLAQRPSGRHASC